MHQPLLSILDQSPIRAGGTAAQALGDTIDLAKRCDALGYHRYWVAEHHNTKSFAGSAPEVLIARLAAETKTMRIGSGGVMMPHYSPLKVAETFRLLETLYPGRIDLGLGRAAGAEPRTTAALMPGPKAYPLEVFPQQVQLLTQFLEDSTGLEGDAGGFPEDHPYRGIHAAPMGPGVPDMWLLGSGGDSAMHAAQFGLSYCYAHFINPESPDRAFETYRRHFRPSRTLKTPRASMGVSVMVAETEDEARRICASRNLWVLWMMQGKPGPFPTIEDALSYPYTDEEKEIIKGIEARGMTGTPEQVKDQLLTLASEHDVEEFALVTITHDHAHRVRSYELLADAFALAKAA
ncbi:LLM class flavin-dependent oxidoreductase [Pyruvatibacter sp.]|uniref:LLM class flavin-dependent oxidoreductase n=1 Tax=Pyruvatibacter sp. TaxID=1981328 RepID=UPI003266C65E